VLSKIEPYSGPTSECAKCGNGSQLSPGPEIFPRMQHATLRVRYCPGGKELEETEENPLTAFLQLVSSESISSKFRSVSLKRVNICAGIGEDHLHVTCVDCGYEWLTHTKERGEPPKMQSAASKTAA
jgi:Zn ribbon nucleic-acid-binding protein